MLSVKESARVLGVSPARVRALIAEGRLPAAKVGRAWVLREEDVAERLSLRAKAGRPAKGGRAGAGVLANGGPQPEDAHSAPADDALHELYLSCKRTFRCRPDARQMAQMENAEEAAFRMAVADFFLQQKQAELVRGGAF